MGIRLDLYWEDQPKNYYELPGQTIRSNLKPVVSFMPMISSSTLRRLAAAPRCGRAAVDALSHTEIRVMASARPSAFTIPLRSSSGGVLAGAQSQKHLLSEFVGVRGPVAEEVRNSLEQQRASRLRMHQLLLKNTISFFPRRFFE